MTKNRSILLFGFNFVLVMGVVVFFILQNRFASTNVPAQSEDIDGITDLPEPQAISNFTLTNQQGEEVQLSDFEGKFVLVYFGFTHCPDFCPATLGDYRLIKQQLGDAVEDVVFLFISVDPERDTPEVLDNYIRRFDPSFIAATGAETTLNEITSDFGTTYSYDAHAAGESYAVQHSSSKFLLNPSGHLTTVYSFGIPHDMVAEDIQAKMSS